MNTKLSELDQANRFLEWLHLETGERYEIVAHQDRPDFLIASKEKKTFLEVTSVFSCQEEADWLFSQSTHKTNVAER